MMATYVLEVADWRILGESYYIEWMVMVASASQHDGGGIGDITRNPEL